MAENAVDVARTLYRTRMNAKATHKRSAATLGGMTAFAAKTVAAMNYSVGQMFAGNLMMQVGKRFDRTAGMLNAEGDAAERRGKAGEHFILRQRGRGKRADMSPAAVSASRVALGRQAAGNAAAEQRTPTVPHPVAVAMNVPHSDRAALGATGSGNTKRGFQNANNLKAALQAQGKRTGGV